MQFALKNLLAGIIIGIPNYFSIWCLVRFLKVSPWQSSASIPVNNMGIVLFSSVVAWLLFREKLSQINWLGIVLSLVAIYLIAFGDKL
jgi:drug/metabolite transporter (DMT)-like permease